jgi:hypothetical protein
MDSFIWSSTVEGNNLCFLCANYMKKKFFCTDPEDTESVVMCKYFLPLSMSDIEADIARLEIMEKMLG